MRLIIVLLSFITLFGCDPVDDRLHIINHSDKKICYYISKDTTIQEWIYDYVKPYYVTPNKDTINKERDIIPPGDSIKEVVLGVGNAWKTHVENEFPDSTMHIFILDAERLEELATYTAIMEDNILRRYDLHVKELEKLNWRVVYDGKN